MITFMIHKGKDGQYYVRIATENNEPWFTSEGYSTRSNARRSARDFFHKMVGDKEFKMIEDFDE